MDDADKHSITAASAKKSLPQYNLEGIWGGRYQDEYKLVNITYVGEGTLVATKITGDRIDLLGEVSFYADVSASSVKGSSTSIKPIK